MLEPGNLTPDHLQLLDELRRVTESTTLNFRNGPTYQHLEHELAGENGILKVYELLQDLAPDYLSFEDPLENRTGILLRARGWHTSQPHSSVIHRGLIPAVRGCYDRFMQFRPPSPTEAEPVIVRPADLWPPDSMPMRWQLFVVGRLLEVERVGIVTWTGDAASPWRVELDASIRRFANVGDYPSFVQAADPPVLAVAS